MCHALISVDSHTRNAYFTGLDTRPPFRRRVPPVAAPRHILRSILMRARRVMLRDVASALAFSLGQPAQYISSASIGSASCYGEES